MLLCDVCGRKMTEKENKERVHTEFAYGVWQSKEMDLCFYCKSDLNDERHKAEAEFLQNRSQRKE